MCQVCHPHTFESADLFSGMVELRQENVASTISTMHREHDQHNARRTHVLAPLHKLEQARTQDRTRLRLKGEKLLMQIEPRGMKLLFANRNMVDGLWAQCRRTQSIKHKSEEKIDSKQRTADSRQQSAEGALCGGTFSLSLSSVIQPCTPPTFYPRGRISTPASTSIFLFRCVLL
jgi:hypothetical protein